MISKELLSLVLDKNVVAIDVNETDSNIEENTLEYIYRDNDFVSHGFSNDEKLNLDTLGRECKEWCHIKGFFIKIHYPLNRVDIAVSVAQDNTTIFGEKEFIENTELEAIIKATEWVAKEKGLL